MTCGTVANSLPEKSKDLRVLERTVIVVARLAGDTVQESQQQDRERDSCRLKQLVMERGKRVVKSYTFMTVWIPRHTFQHLVESVQHRAKAVEKTLF